MPGLSASVRAAVGEFQELLGADGARVRLVENTVTELTFALELEGAGCAECVMPQETLESILFHQVSAVDPDIARVRILDPRT